MFLLLFLRPPYRVDTASEVLAPLSNTTWLQFSSFIPRPSGRHFPLFSRNAPSIPMGRLFYTQTSRILEYPPKQKSPNVRCSGSTGGALTIVITRGTQVNLSGQGKTIHPAKNHLTAPSLASARLEYRGEMVTHGCGFCDLDLSGVRYAGACSGGNGWICCVLRGSCASASAKPNVPDGLEVFSHWRLVYILPC